MHFKIGIGKSQELLGRWCDVPHVAAAVSVYETIDLMGKTCSVSQALEAVGIEQEKVERVYTGAGPMDMLSRRSLKATVYDGDFVVVYLKEGQTVELPLRKVNAQGKRQVDPVAEALVFWTARLRDCGLLKDALKRFEESWNAYFKDFDLNQPRNNGIAIGTWHGEAYGALLDIIRSAGISSAELPYLLETYIYKDGHRVRKNDGNLIAKNDKSGPSGNYSCRGSITGRLGKMVPIDPYSLPDPATDPDSQCGRGATPDLAQQSGGASAAAPTSCRSPGGGAWTSPGLGAGSVAPTSPQGRGQGAWTSPGIDQPCDDTDNEPWPTWPPTGESHFLQSDPSLNPNVRVFTSPGGKSIEIQAHPISYWTGPQQLLGWFLQSQNRFCTAVSWVLAPAIYLLWFAAYIAKLTGKAICEFIGGKLDRLPRLISLPLELVVFLPVLPIGLATIYLSALYDRLCAADDRLRESMGVKRGVWWM